MSALGLFFSNLVIERLVFNECHPLDSYSILSIVSHL